MQTIPPAIDQAASADYQRRWQLARARLSHARMYLRDLQNNADFGRMVDSKGSNFPGCTRANWMERVQRIAVESSDLCPVEAAQMLEDFRVWRAAQQDNC